MCWFTYLSPLIGYLVVSVAGCLGYDVLENLLGGNRYDEQFQLLVVSHHNLNNQQLKQQDDWE
jgi:hypothetical protein